MKLKSLLWTLGLRPSVRKYGTERLEFQLERDGAISFERWLHPKDRFVPFRQSYIDRLRNYIQPGDAVLDIGAHCGDFTVPLALAAGPEGIVFAWEPNPYVYEVLAKNASLNLHATRIVPVQAAAAPEDCQLLFHYSDPGFSNGGNLAGISRWTHGHAFELQVPALRVESWLEREYPEWTGKIRFVKVDTEGFDLEVLRSLETTLMRQRPTIHVEFYKHLSTDRRKMLWAYLTRLGYTVYTTDPVHNIDPHQRIEEADVTRWDHFDAIAIPAPN